MAKHVDRADQIGVFLEAAFHAGELRLTGAVVHRHMAAARTGAAGVLRRHGDEMSTVPYQLVVQLAAEQGELSLAIEIPAGFARDIARGVPVQLGAWVDGAMPTRAETVRGYVLAMHQSWQVDMAKHRLGVDLAAASTLETRYRDNPDVKNLPAMVPAVIPILLMMIPAMPARPFSIAVPAWMWCGRRCWPSSPSGRHCSP